jgi:hypothetical protein
LSTLLVVPLAGCAGGLHHQGEHQISLTGSYSHPFDPDGRGDAGGVTAGYKYFFQDRFAFMANLTPYRNYCLPEGNATAGEFQIGVRWHFWEFEVAELPVGLYAELLAGIMHASRSVPETGAHTNFAEDIGAGVELQVAENVYWTTGCRLRHMSHADILDGPNPGQDDVLIYTGLAFSLN